MKRIHHESKLEVFTLGFELFKKKLGVDWSSFPSERYKRILITSNVSNVENDYVKFVY